jgi:DNA-binding NarL/FixJ family response regulator
MPMKTALLLDDSPRWRAMVAEALRADGWSVTHAAAPGPDAPARAGLACDLLIVAVPPVGADLAPALACLNRLNGSRARCILLAARPAAAVEPALAGHPRVLGIIEKAAFSAADLLALARPAAAAPPAPSAPPAAGLRVLVVEDDAAWRGIYAEVLAEAGYGLDSAVSYGEARGWLQRVAYDVVLVDLNLASSAAPEGNRDGFFLLRAARQRGIPAIVVSALGDPADIDRAYDEFGIFAFVEKEGFDRANFARLLAAAQRAEPEPDADPDAPGLEQLTPREREVLGLLIQGLTNRQIAEALLISANTTKKHVDHILQKLGVSTRAGAVAAALKLGMR